MLQAARVLLLLRQGQASILLLGIQGRSPPSSSSCSSARSRCQCYARLRAVRWLKANRRPVLVATAYTAAAAFLLQQIQQVGGCGLDPVWCREPCELSRFCVRVRVCCSDGDLLLSLAPSPAPPCALPCECANDCTAVMA